MQINYACEYPTLQAFHASEAFVRAIRGPIGSGKTVACCYELMRLSFQQEPSPIDGWKRTRWGIIRNTYPQLLASTIKTWQAEFPKNRIGSFKNSPPYQHVILDPASKIEAEFWFLALDNEENQRDLLSTEWTGFFVNEAREIPKSLIDDIISRARRYPAMKHGGPSHPCVLLDTNAPDHQHWWAVMSGDCPPPEFWSEEQRALYQRPSDWEFFTQPPALLEVRDSGRIVGYDVNPDAENLSNLHPDYYRRQWQGKDKDWIDVYLMNRYKTIKAGKPIYPQFSQDVHVAAQPIRYDPLLKTWIGLDFGLTPAGVLVQQRSSGQYVIVAEWVTLDMTIPKFAAMVARDLAMLGVNYELLEGWGDPAGDSRDSSGNVAFALCHAEGLDAAPCLTNDPSVRQGAVTAVLMRMIEGQPGMLVSPECQYIIQGFIHGYRFRKIRTAGDRYEEKPDKNIYSHVHDALQYAMLGAGEGHKLMVNEARAASAISYTAPRRANVWGRHRPGSQRFGT